MTYSLTHEGRRYIGHCTGVPDPRLEQALAQLGAAWRCLVEEFCVSSIISIIADEYVALSKSVDPLQFGDVALLYKRVAAILASAATEIECAENLFEETK